MSADLLRQAAATLRRRAEYANPAPWRSDLNAVRTGRDALALTYSITHVKDSSQTRKDADYIATMHPGVGLALGDLLDVLASHVNSYECMAHCEPDGCDPVVRAEALARLIVGEQS